MRLKSGGKAACERIELRVQEDGVDQLIYQFENIAEAMETLSFIEEFFPRARYLIQPLTQ